MQLVPVDLQYLFGQIFLNQKHCEPLKSQDIGPTPKPSSLGYWDVQDQRHLFINFIHQNPRPWGIEEMTSDHGRCHIICDSNLVTMFEILRIFVRCVQWRIQDGLVGGTKLQRRRRRNFFLAAASSLFRSFPQFLLFLCLFLSWDEKMLDFYEVSFK